MVALLWDAGDVLAAIELEELWNELGRELQFSLLCAYRSESVTAPEHADALQRVCHLHSSVLHRCPPPAPALVGVEISAEFPANRDAPRFARYFVADALASWGHSPALIADAQLLVTELATNAVIHAHSQFAVVARSEAARVRLSVSDASLARPAPRHAGPMAMSGRGLQIVAALSAAWGVDLTGDGKTVWAELRS
jgi:anti-sigma regulatory factor (Ser/Thr protein kinase)